MVIVSFLLTADIVKDYTVNDFDEIKLYFLNHHQWMFFFYY